MQSAELVSMVMSSVQSTSRRETFRIEHLQVVNVLLASLKLKQSIYFVLDFCVAQ